MDLIIVYEGMCVWTRIQFRQQFAADSQAKSHL